MTQIGKAKARRTIECGAFSTCIVVDDVFIVTSGAWLAFVVQKSAAAMLRKAIAQRAGPGNAGDTGVITGRRFVKVSAACCADHAVAVKARETITRKGTNRVSAQCVVNVAIVGVGIAFVDIITCEPIASITSVTRAHVVVSSVTS